MKKLILSTICSGALLAGTFGAAAASGGPAITSPQVKTTVLLSNGGFESGQSPWQTYSSGSNAIIGSSASSHAGAQDATLCGTNNCVDALWQAITVPADADQATLTLWINATSQEASGACNDSVSLGFFTSAGALIGNPITACNLNTNGTWVQVTLDVSSYLLASQGQQIYIGFVGLTNSTLPSTFALDDVSLTSTK